jgi:hypothetical protein
MALPDWSDLARLSGAELATHDLAVVNLACAAGLPGTVTLDPDRCLATVASWAAHVARETERAKHQFASDRAAFHDSWAYFRVLVLATVLQEDCGVRYDPALVDRDDFFKDAANLFIHGVLAGKGGTCSSLPPLYVAIGRRLGYPLKLVQTNSHLFARWEEPATSERFNIECTSRGLNCHGDDYYLNWPVPTTPPEVERCGWLQSQTPREELAGFLATRGHCWLDNQRFRDAAAAYAWASSLAPRHSGYATCLAATLNDWRTHLERAMPPHFPRVTVHLPQRRFPELAVTREAEIVHLEVIEDLLGNPLHQRDWWAPLWRQPHVRPPHVPSQITVRDPAALRSLR